MHIKKFFTNSKGKIVVFQAPNLPIIAWFVFLLLSKMLTTHNWQLWAGYISTVSLLLWAVLEIGWGASYFRRTLGLAVFVIVTASRLIT